MVFYIARGGDFSCSNMLASVTSEKSGQPRLPNLEPCSATTAERW